MNYESDREIRREALGDDEKERTEPVGDDSSLVGESHATTGGAAAAGAVTGGVIGLTGGPVGAAIGAVGGAIVGAAAERMMHGDDEDRPATSDETEVEEPVGEPMAEVEDAEHKKPRPLI